MKLTPAQRSIADDPTRFKVVCAGRRFGKSFLAIREMCYRARIPGKNIYYIAPSYRNAKSNLWKPLKHKLLKLRWVKKINESELTIELKNGSSISLKGAENYDSLRGASLSYVVIDEASILDLEPVWVEVVRPALADQQGGALIIGTPKGKGNYFYQMWVECNTLKGYKNFHFTSLQGGNINPSEIEEARATTSARYFNQEYEATFETYVNRVAWAFDRDASVIDMPKEISTDVIHVGMDFNVSPATAAICIKHGEHMIQIDEIMMFSSNTDEMVEEIRNRYPKSKVFVYPDPSGNQRRTSAAGNTDHKILQNAGFILKAPRKHDPVKDRINCINARFENANGERHLFIVNTCKNTIECLDKYSFKQGTQIPDKTKDFDHMFDALSYCIAYLYPIKKKVEHKEPQRWGHSIA